MSLNRSVVFNNESVITTRPLLGVKEVVTQRSELVSE
jgi:hypothetical protein